MCGRYYRSSDKQKIADSFRLHGDLSGVMLDQANYNIAPGTFQPVIRHDEDTGERELVLMRWGFIPHYIKELASLKGFSTINARAESLLTSPTWRGSIRSRRCIIPADGFYEWKKIDAKFKQPFAFSMADGASFAFAGLWDAWREPGRGWLQSYSIVTTKANGLMAPVHNRMPVILKPGDYLRWMDSDANPDLPLDLLVPCDSEAMQANPCNTLVGSVRNNGPDMLNSA
jgi:putative SOS response-associated peptidase YedK